MSSASTAPATRARTPAWRDAMELLASMRFAIALLAIICIASVVGTVVRQQEPLNNYVNQFGPFWADVFGVVGIYTVYSAWWFLLILAFLVISVSLCIARNAPKIVADLRSFKENLREQALHAFHHKAEGALDEVPETARSRVEALLVQAGWRLRTQVRDGGVMIAARKGSLNKIGYLAAHSAIVLICLGGLSDGDLIVRAQMKLHGKEVFTGGGSMAEVPDKYRLGVDNPTFRGNLFVPEGQRAGTAVLSMPTGVVLQDLPFDVELKKFIVDYYATGMPKLFASEIVIHDRDTGASTAATVKVNEPAFHRGVAIYQSSFDDGGSALAIRAWPLDSSAATFDVNGTVGASTELRHGDETLGLEFTGLRVINVENLGGGERGGSGTDVRKVDLVGAIEQHLGSGAKPGAKKELRNIGPSISYKLRDAAGQAREFNNYMLPVEIDGQSLFLAGVRESAQEGYRYLRIPADENASVETWLRLRRALIDPAARDRAARRYVALAAPTDKPEVTEQLRITASKALSLFAGAEKSRAIPAATDSDALARAGGLPAIGQFIESSVPEAERNRISEVLLRILNGSVQELANVAREDAGQPAMEAGPKTQAFMNQAVLALSDSFFYPAPVFLELTDFRQVQASVFQVTRAPGKKLVYLGAILLIVGVFSMLYVRERRLWVWLKPAGDGGSRLAAALSSPRRTLDADSEFDRLKKALLKDSA